MFILLGRILYAAIWFFLLLNIVLPYPEPANYIAYIALISMVITHGLQAWLLSSTLTKKERDQDRFIIWRTFFFGIFEALSWKKSKNNQ